MRVSVYRITTSDGQRALIQPCNSAQMAVDVFKRAYPFVKGNSIKKVEFVREFIRDKGI